MKRYAHYALAVLGGILEDAATRWPEQRASFGKDLSYLRRAVDKRGLPFLTGVLPTMGKCLDKALDDGSFGAMEMPQGYPLIQKRPELFWGLFRKVINDRCICWAEPDVDAIAFLRQLLYCCKKLRLTCDASKTEDTLDEFFAIERFLPPIRENTWGSKNPEWTNPEGHPLWGDTTESHGDLLERGGPRSRLAPHYWGGLRLVSRYVIAQLGEPDWWGISPQHGPGAVSEPIKGRSKYDFPNWTQRLEEQFPFDWFGSGILDDEYRPRNRELPSKLHAVPKDQSGPRLICAEPLAHAWIQQGIWRWLEGRMRRTFIGASIDLRNQEHSRNGALRSSMDCESATVDLSSASDRLSARLVEYIFAGSSLLDGFNACRTQYVYQDISTRHDSHHALRKFSTQGSALTMPVQSIVYLVLCIFAIKWHRCTELMMDDIEKVARSVRVYGDDLIVPADCLQAVKLVFHECGLKVNSMKTYGGRFGFRESCGIQAFRGSDVTYVSILQPHDDSPSSMATTVEVSNNLFKAGYWNASRVVLDQIPIKERKLLRITGPEDGAFGLFSFTGSDTSHLKKGWDPDLQRGYSISLAVTSKVRKARGRGLADLTQWFTELPGQLYCWKPGTVSGVRLRKHRTRVLG